jgi:hypothetical protein
MSDPGWIWIVRAVRWGERRARGGRVCNNKSRKSGRLKLYTHLRDVPYRHTCVARALLAFFLYPKP